jgi:hypothetical protein
MRETKKLEARLNHNDGQIIISLLRRSLLSRRIDQTSSESSEGVNRVYWPCYILAVGTLIDMDNNEGRCTDSMHVRTKKKEPKSTVVG